MVFENTVLIAYLDLTWRKQQEALKNSIMIFKINILDQILLM
jgi:hypothetical protein